MLSSKTEQKVRQHLKLAKGLLETAVVGPESSEFDERNALSRAYYAMFHVCCAWLACKYGIVTKLKHFDVRDLRGMREAADYREEWRPQRRVTEDRLAKVESALRRLEAEIETELIR